MNAIANLGIWLAKKYAAEILFEIMVWTAKHLAGKTTTTWDDEKVKELVDHKDEVIGFIKKL
jgi:hypothetical protein